MKEAIDAAGKLCLLAFAAIGIYAVYAFIEDSRVAAQAERREAAAEQRRERNRATMHEGPKVNIIEADGTELIHISIPSMTFRSRYVRWRDCFVVRDTRLQSLALHCNQDERIDDSN